MSAAGGFVEAVTSAGLALGLLLATRMALLWAGVDWQPGMWSVAMALALAGALVRLAVMLDDTGPGRDINGVFLYSTTFFGIAFNPVHWVLWPRATYRRAEWPRSITIEWLMFAMQWEYSPDPPQGVTK